jgi:outer membrane protein assembly factor BamA
MGYGHRDTSYDAVAGYRFGDKWAASVRVGGLESQLHELELPAPDVTPPVLPSLGAQLSYFRLSSQLALDTRDRAGDPRSGSFLSVSLSRYDDRSLGAYSFDRLGFEARHYQPLGSRRHVLAVRALGSVSHTRGGSRVPLHLQPTLGGSHTLRGYETFRFRGKRVFTLSGEYRFQAHRAVELAAFYDAGWITGGLDDLTRSGFASNVGLGIRLKTGSSVAVRLDVARGDEGTRVHLRLGRSF